MEKLHENVHVFVLLCKFLNMKAQTLACFHVNFPTFTPKRPLASQTSLVTAVKT